MDPGTVDTKMLRAGWGSWGSPVSTATTSFEMLTQDPTITRSQKCRERERRTLSDFETLWSLETACRTNFKRALALEIRIVVVREKHRGDVCGINCCSWTMHGKIVCLDLLGIVPSVPKRQLKSQNGDQNGMQVAPLNRTTQWDPSWRQLESPQMQYCMLHNFLARGNSRERSTHEKSKNAENKMPTGVRWSLPAFDPGTR